MLWLKHFFTFSFQKIGLQINVNLENLTKFRPEGDDFRWYVKLKCANCGEETTSFQYMCLEESHPVKGGRGSASLVIKCHLCGRENTIDIIKDSLKSYDADDVGKFKTIVVFDCRGVEPTDFSPRTGFVAEGTDSGVQFNEITLSDGDWCDYDERSKVSVGVYEFQHKFVKSK
ncbi:CXXC motif containing zinc binding protein-like [Liolophura sinensis]|uniref:CXXC motif containing zinc binding protein-like n=1 Tax=Liolophura sinensis TaxID=3198878 RepID=UPI0031581E4B